MKSDAKLVMSTLTSTLAQRRHQDDISAEKEDLAADSIKLRNKEEEEEDEKAENAFSREVVESSDNEDVRKNLIKSDRGEDTTTPEEACGLLNRPSRSSNRLSHEMNQSNVNSSSLQIPGISGNQQQPTSNQTKLSTTSNRTLDPSNNTNHHQSHKQSSKFMDSQQMHVCRLCDKLLSSSSSLDRHMLTHSGERPFVCKRCHMTFTTNGNMHRHMRTHLHKDSLARQQQEQQLKSLVAAAGGGAPLSATSTSQQHHHQSQSINNSNLINQAHHHQVTSPISAYPTSLAPIGASADSRPFGPIANSIHTPSSSSITALLNQHLVAALRHQQPVGNKFRALQQHMGSEVSTSLDSSISIPTTTTSTSTAAHLHAHPLDSQASEFLRHRQLNPEALIMGLQSGGTSDQLNLESVKAMMLAAAAAAAVTQQQQQQPLQLNHEDERQEWENEEEEVLDEDDPDLNNVEQNRLRGKRRKQINPRSTRTYPQTTTASFHDEESNADEEDEYHTESCKDLVSQPECESTLKDCEAKRKPTKLFEHNTSLLSSADNFIRSNNISLDDEETDQNEDDEVVSNSNSMINDTSAAIKREVVEDFNNNQGEEDNIERNEMKTHERKQRIRGSTGGSGSSGHEETDELDEDEEEEEVEEEEEEDIDEEDEESIVRMNMSIINSEDSLGSDINMSDHNNSSHLSLTPFESARNTNDNNTFDGDYQQAGNNHQAASIGIHSTLSPALPPQPPITTSITNTTSVPLNNHQQSLPNLLTTSNGEIIEDISQSYVKTANPNAARKGGKRNRHCYKCKLCTYSSVDRCTLVRHLRIHSGERPYICGICRYAFTTKANCERHVRKRHKKQYNSLGGAGGGGVKGSNGGGRSLIITDHSNHQTIPVKVNPVAAQTISQTLQRIQEKQKNLADDELDNNIERIPNNHHLNLQQQQQQNLIESRTKGRDNQELSNILTATTTTSLGNRNKRKQRSDDRLDQRQSTFSPYQRKRIAAKQDDFITSATRSIGSRKNNMNMDLQHSNGTSTNLLFNANNNLNVIGSSIGMPDMTNDLFTNLMVQLQQVSNASNHDSTQTSNNNNASTASLLGLPQASPVPSSTQVHSSATFLANMLAASKTLGAQQQQSTSADGHQNQLLEASQQASLLSPKQLSQQIAQLRNLNPQASFFIRKKTFDPFNPIDLAAQALDLSCKFQTSNH